MPAPLAPTPAPAPPPRAPTLLLQVVMVVGMVGSLDANIHS
jgi:hypothetical protein